MSSVSPRPERSGSPAKKVAAAVAGGILTLVGLAALVLPGPGFVLVAAGLAVLSTQFRWARRPLKYARAKAQVGIDEVARSRPRAALALAFGAALVAVGVLGVLGVKIPFVTVVSGVLLVLSGLFLLGTVVYARRRGPAATAVHAEPARPRVH